MFEALRRQRIEDRDAAGDAAVARLDAENAGDQRGRYAELILGAFENIALILQQRNTFANPRIIDAARIPGPGFGAFRRLLFLHDQLRSEEHTSELQSLMRISNAVFCL